MKEVNPNSEEIALVSVVIPVFNGEEYIEECLESVYRQTYDPFEVVIVDDGSTDGTHECIKRMNGDAKVIRQKNQGVGHARNVAIRNAKGAFIAFMDHDDIWVPEKIEKQMAAIHGDNIIDVIYSPATPFSGSGKAHFQSDKHELSKALNDQNLFESLVHKNLLPITATIVRKKSLERAGMFDASFRTCGDYELWLRMAALGMRFHYLPVPLTLGRKHGKNISKQTELMHANRIRAIEKTFAMEGLTAEQRSLKNSALSSAYMMGAHSYFSARRYDKFLANASTAFKLNKKVMNMKFITRYLRSWLRLAMN